MATLLIPTEAFASWLETDLEGRLEVMADDSLQDSPDYIDADSVAQALRETKAFPATITLSDSEAVQAAISVENYMDFADADESPADGKAAYAHLESQGYYTNARTTVLAYFFAKLGTVPTDPDENKAMDSMPLVSNCGDDCKLAIDRAAAFIESIRQAYGDHKPELIRNTIDAAADVICCFICG